MTGRQRLMAGGVTAVILGGIWAFGGGRLASSEWAKVERGDLIVTVDVSGTLRAVNSELVGPPQVPDVWEFKIAMMAPEGKDVKAGQPVLGFDTSELQRKLLEKQAEGESAAKRIEKKEKDAEIAKKDAELHLAEAESRASKDRLQLDVPEDLVKSQDLKAARLDLEDAEKEIAFQKEKLGTQERADKIALETLRAQKAAADARVQAIQATVESMTVKAKRAGTVVYVTDEWRNEKKKVGDAMWRGAKVLEIPDLTAMRADGEIDESDAGRVAVGQRVRFRLEAHPDVEFTGKVASIWSAVQRESRASPQKVVKLDIAFDATDPRKMRPGMRFRGTIETDRRPQVVLVPADALFPTANGPVAFRKTGMGHERRVLSLGVRNDQSVEVLSGITPGDLVARRDLDAPDEASR